MIPDNELSTTPVVSPLMFPKNTPVVGLEAFELGGVALNNPSQGLMVKPWRAFIDDLGNTYVEAAGVPPTFVVNLPDVSTLSLTFDQNMNVFLAFTQSGQAKFYWFDPIASAYTITNLPVGSTFPRCSLDDKRELASSTSDIIVAYLRNGNLYFRQQRDRYLIEYLLYPDINLDIIDAQIIEIGMGNNLRFQFHTAGAFFPV